jgi:hypothetical protein
LAQIKKEYYQAQRPNEDITEWIDFFLESLINVQYKLQKKLESTEQANSLSPKEKSVYVYINEHNTPNVSQKILQ